MDKEMKKMKFEDVINELRNEKLARRKNWLEENWIGYDWGSSRLSKHCLGIYDQYIQYKLSLED
jgi:hypothetical protein